MSEPKNTCNAALNIVGEHYPCEMDAPHPGLAHASGPAGAIWTEDHEALTSAWAGAEAAGR